MAIEAPSGVHWLIEVKMDKEMTAADVVAKREAAKRWASHVSHDSTVSAAWKYLLVSEAHVDAAHDSWMALKGLGGE